MPCGIRACRATRRKAMLPAVARATGMEWAALAMPGTGGALSWVVAAPESMALSRVPADKVKQVLGGASLSG